VLIDILPGGTADARLRDLVAAINALTRALEIREPDPDTARDRLAEDLR
jgi:hypothetical protein